jgi:large subunit ribosomal protein L18
MIDDTTQRVLFAISSSSLKDLKGKKRIEVAMEVGKAIGKIAVDKGIKQVAFDRAGYKYHGRVKALAEGARAAGLEF